MKPNIAALDPATYPRFKIIWIWKVTVSKPKDKDFLTKTVDVMVFEYEDEPVEIPSEYHHQIALKYVGEDSTLKKFDFKQYKFSWIKDRILNNERTGESITRHLK